MRPVITSTARIIRLNRRWGVVATWGRRHWRSATMSSWASSQVESCSRGGRQLYDRPTTEALPGYNFWRRYCDKQPLEFSRAALDLDGQDVARAFVIAHGIRRQARHGRSHLGRNQIHGRMLHEM